jgi:hypothetical protein
MSCAAQTPYGNIEAQDGNRAVVVDTLTTTVISARSEDKDVIVGSEDYLIIIIKDSECTQELSK